MILYYLVKLYKALLGSVAVAVAVAVAFAVAVAVAVAVEAPRGSQRLPGVDFGAAGARVSRYSWLRYLLGASWGRPGCHRRVSKGRQWGHLGVLGASVGRPEVDFGAAGARLS